MTLEQLRAAHTAQPFRPFTMHLADGRKVPVLHAESLAREPAGRTVFVFQPEGTYNLVDLLLVTDLEFTADDGDSARH